VPSFVGLVLQPSHNQHFIAILFNSLLIIALLEFGCTLLYYLYRSHLYKIERVSALIAKIDLLVCKLQSRYQSKAKETSSDIPLAMHLEHLREELLFTDAD